MKDQSVDQFSAIIGIDWADQKHDICVCDPATGTVTSMAVISSKPEAVHEWALAIRQQYPDKPVAVACELKKRPPGLCADEVRAHRDIPDSSEERGQVSPDLQLKRSQE